MALPQPVLTRFEITVLKDKSATDKSQVPAQATIEFYAQGATASAATVIPPFSPIEPPPTYDITVFDTGTVVEGDNIEVGGTSAVFPVVAVNATAKRITVTSNLATDTPIEVGTRLLVVSRPLGLFQDPVGLLPYVGSVVTSSTTGRPPTVYVREPRFDFVVSGTGISPPRVYPDAVGGSTPSPSWVNARDYSSIQAAVDALPDIGGVVYLPPGTYKLSASLIIDKHNVTLQGDGNFAIGSEFSTVIEPETPGQFTLVEVRRHAFRMRDLQLNGRVTELVTPLPQFACLLIDGSYHPLESMSHCILENVSIQSSPNYGLWLKDALSFLATNCEFLYNWGPGIRAENAGKGSTTVHFFGCQASANKGPGAEIDNVSSCSFIAGSFVGNQGGGGVDEGNGISARLAPGLEILGCFFQNAETTVKAKQFIFVDNSASAVVESSTFFWGTHPPERMARFRAAGGLRFTNNVEQIGTTGSVDEMLWVESSKGPIVFGNVEVGLEQPRYRFTGPISTIPALSRNAASVIASDFPSLQAAVGALPASGGTVYIPEGVYDADSSTKFVAPLLLPLDRPVRLIGAGQGSTILQGTNNGSTFPRGLVQLRGHHQSLAHLTVRGIGASSSLGRGVVVGRSTASGDAPSTEPILAALLEECAIEDAGAYGLYLLDEDEGGGTASTQGRVEGLQITDAGIGADGTAGIRVGPACDGWSFSRVVTRLHRTTHHMHLDEVTGATIEDGEFVTLAGATIASAIRMVVAVSVRLSRCTFACKQTSLNGPFVRFSGVSSSIALEQCLFDYGLGAPLYDILIEDGYKVLDLLLTNPRFEKAASGQFEIRADDASEFQIVGGTVFRLGASPETLPVRVDPQPYGTSSQRYLMTPGVGARLRLPVLTSGDYPALADKRKGDVVYVGGTVNAILYYDGSGWQKLKTV